MATKQTTRVLYDVQEYKQKIEQALSKVREQKAGEATGKAGKNEILSMFKKEIAELVKDGYTSQQIAAAIKNDAFGILPKTITELVGTKQATKPKKQTNDTVNKTPVAQKQENNKAAKSHDNSTFKIQPDEEV
jgi:hypothetical protein